MLRIGSLCTGAGMLDHAAAAVVGGQTVWVAESDPDASRVLSFRYGVPNLGDITAVDWTAVEPVDVLVAGYPCQDLSNAGKRAGIEGKRSGVWRHVADAVRHLRPRLVLLENVRGHLARGFGRVLGDLAELGYDTDWTCLRASDVGAAHQRDRVFIVAAPADPDRGRVRVEPVAVGTRLGEAVVGGDREEPLMPTPTASLGRGSVVLPGEGTAMERRAAGKRFLDDAVALLPTPAARDATRGAGWGEEPGRPLSETIVRLLPTPTSTNSHGNTENNRGEQLLPGVALDEARWLQYGPAIRRWEAVLGRPAPEPTIIGKRGGRRLSARFVEWLMGWPDGWVTDLVDNTAALRICGNGVVPQQAAAAYRALLDGAT